MSEAQKKITVCLCAYNAERFIAQAVESILAQTYTNWELYVVNDTSTGYITTLMITANQTVSKNRLRIYANKT